MARIGYSYHFILQIVLHVKAQLKLEFNKTYFASDTHDLRSFVAIMDQTIRDPIAIASAIELGPLDLGRLGIFQD